MTDHAKLVKDAQRNYTEAEESMTEPTVTDADFDAANEWWRPYEAEHGNEQELYEAFARHREAAEQAGAEAECNQIGEWLRSLDREGGEINRFLPTTLANWIDEGMHYLK
jgi:hypothetical protein